MVDASCYQPTTIGDIPTILVQIAGCHWTKPKLMISFFKGMQWEPNNCKDPDEHVKYEDLD